MTGDSLEKDDGLLKDVYDNKPKEKKRGWKENLLEYLFTSPEGVLGKRKRNYDEQLGETTEQTTPVKKEK